jgi:hypothetical protein
MSTYKMEAPRRCLGAARRGGRCECESRLKINPRQRGRKQHFGDMANKL